MVAELDHGNRSRFLRGSLVLPGGYSRLLTRGCHATVVAYRFRTSCIAIARCTETCQTSFLRNGKFELRTRLEKNDDNDRLLLIFYLETIRD